MKCIRIFNTGWLVLALGALVTFAQEKKPELDFREQFAAQLDEWLPGIGAEKIPDRQGPQQELQSLCFSLGAPGRESERAIACEVIADKLGEGNSPAKIWMLKQLEFVGRGECVDGVADLLDDSDPHVRHAARRCLENNPDPSATAKLTGALADSRGSWRVGLINSLGTRGDQSSIGALAELLHNQDRATASAAANALGKIGTPKAAAVLRDALPDAAKWLAEPLADAYLRCADAMLKLGKTSEAASVYDQLATHDSPRAIRLAAMKGRLNAAGDKAADMILELLESDDADARAIAAGHLEGLSGVRAIRCTPEQFAKLPASGQVLLLSAVAASRDRSALPLAITATKSGDLSIRLAGLRALGELGDPSVVGMLVKTIAAGDEAGDAARGSLEQIIADGVDEAIVSAMQEAQDSGLRGRLIEVLDRRMASIAAPALLKEAAESQDPGVRTRAMRTLGNVADPRHATDMVRILAKIPKGRERDDAEKAIMVICSRIAQDEDRADPVLTVLDEVGNQDTAAVLPLLGRIGGKKALAAIQRAMTSNSAEVQEAAVRGLCNWPDASVADELLKMAKSSHNRSWRVSALRAYVRVVTLPNERSDTKTLALLKAAMDLADRSDEQRLVLTRAASVRSIKTLRWVLPYMDDSSLAEAACQAVVELAHHRGLRDPNKQEFERALKMVIETCQDKNRVDRAKRYLAEL
jgi:HEAT repeat protein